VATCTAERRAAVSTTGWASPDCVRLVAVNNLKMVMHLLAATYPDEAVYVSFQCVIFREKDEVFVGMLVRAMYLRKRRPR
jgi:hypothetical protein